MGTGPTLILIALVAGLALPLRLRRRMRNRALLAEVGIALAQAAGAERAYYRVERRYSDDAEELVRFCPALAGQLDGTRHGERTKWLISTSEDGSQFDIAVMAVPAAEGAYRHMLTAHGHEEDVSYDTFPEDLELLPRA